MENTNDFKFWYPASIEKGSDGKMWISGIASTEHEDLQGEVIKQNGLQLDYFLKRGYLNDDHSKETSGKVGIPVEAMITKKGLWIKGYLLETPRAKGIWELAQALSKSGDDRKLGYSVEGKVLARDSKNPRVITKAWIKDVAVTASPINPNTFLDIAKSFASQDCTQIFVSGEEEEVTKGKMDQLEALQDATKEPVVSQPDEEKKDADETAKQALSEKKPKPELEKQINDVPVAKRAGKSLVTLEIDGEGNVIIKGLAKGAAMFNATTPEIDTAEIGEHSEMVPNECKVCNKKDCKGHEDKVGKPENKTEKKVQMAAGDDSDKEAKVVKNGTGVNKAASGDLEKGFTVVNSLGGERDMGSKKIPIHTITYGHKSSGHHIMVTGKDGAFSVVHMHRKPSGQSENLGGLLFVDDPAKGKKAKEDVDDHLKGFGIKHKFADKDKLMGKAIVSSLDDGNDCDVCKGHIEKGNIFVVADGKSFCDDVCIEKALVSGYAFGATDQVNGGALRIESLEGSQKDLTDSKYILKTDVKEVKFDTARANGGRTQVTLRDAIDFLTYRGLPADMADRILVLMVKNNGDLTKLAQQAKGGK
jgi:hypothetical protein